MLDALHVAWYASLAAESVVLWRLFQLRLPLAWFKVYLAANLLQSIFLLILAGRPTARGYEAVWVSSEPVLLLLVCGVAIEACTRIRENFPGLGRFGQYLIAGFSLLAAVLCYFSIGPELSGANWQHPLFTWAVLAKRWVSTVGAIVLFIVIVFVTITPSRIAPNVRTHAKLLCGYLAIPAIGICLVVLRIADSRSISVCMLCAATVCFAGWSVLMSRKGEERRPADYTRSRRKNWTPAGTSYGTYSQRLKACFGDYRIGTTTGRMAVRNS
jgi:hypothetical protein